MTNDAPDSAKAIRTSRSRLLSYENGLVLVLGLAFGLINFDGRAVSVLMPLIVADLRLDNTHVGLLTAAASLTAAPANLLAGRLSDLLGVRKWPLVAAVATFSLCTVSSGFATTFVVLFAARLLTGVAQGPTPPLLFIIMAEGSAPQRRGLNAGLVGTFGALLGTAAPVVFAALGATYGWRSAFYLTVVPGVIVAALIAAVVREMGAPATQGREPDSTVSIVRTRNVWLSALCACLLAGYTATLLGFAPLYLVQAKQMPSDDMGALLSAAGATGLLVGGALLALSDRVGHKTIASIATLVGAAAPLALLLGQASIAGLLIPMVLGASAATTIPLFIMTIPSGSVPGRSYGTALGFVGATVTIAGGVIVPSVAGWIADRATLAAPLAISLACVVACSACTLLLTETAPRKLAIVG